MLTIIIIKNKTINPIMAKNHTLLDISSSSLYHNNSNSTSHVEYELKAVMLILIE